MNDNYLRNYGIFLSPELIPDSNDSADEVDLNRHQDGTPNPKEEARKIVNNEIDNQFGRGNGPHVAMDRVQANLLQDTLDALCDALEREHLPEDEPLYRRDNQARLKMLLTEARSQSDKVDLAGKVFAFKCLSIGLEFMRYGLEPYAVQRARANEKHSTQKKQRNKWIRERFQELREQGNKKTDCYTKLREELPLAGGCERISVRQIRRIIETR